MACVCDVLLVVVIMAVPIRSTVRGPGCAGCSSHWCATLCCAHNFWQACSPLVTSHMSRFRPVATCCFFCCHALYILYCILNIVITPHTTSAWHHSACSLSSYTHCCDLFFCVFVLCAQVAYGEGAPPEQKPQGKKGRGGGGGSKGSPKFYTQVRRGALWLYIVHVAVHRLQFSHLEPLMWLVSAAAACAYPAKQRFPNKQQHQDGGACMGWCGTCHAASP